MGAGIETIFDLVDSGDMGIDINRGREIIFGDINIG